MLSVQNMHLQEFEKGDELSHAAARRSTRSSNLQSRRRRAGVIAGASTLGAAGALYLATRPGVRKNIGKVYRKVRAKVTSRVRIVARAGQTKKVSKYRTVGRNGPKVSRYAAEHNKISSQLRRARAGTFMAPRITNPYKGRANRTLRRTRAQTGVGYAKNTAYYRSAKTGYKTKIVSTVKRSKFKRVR